jgi:hypothetical protein
MKKIKLSILPLMALAMMLIFASCTDNTAKHIPEDAFAVFVMDGGKLLKNTDSKIILESDEYKEMKNEFDSEYPKTAELVEEVIKDPNKSGLLLKNKMYMFATLVKEELVGGLIIPINRKVLDENLEMIGKEFGFPISLLLKSNGDISYFEDTDYILAFDNNILMVLYNMSSENTLDLAEVYMNQDKSNSILGDKDFKAFLGNCKDMNLWLSSNVAANFKETEDQVKEFEKLTGIDIANNYGHFHLDITKKEIVYTQKVRFNKSIQDADWEKLMENAEKIIELFEDPINMGMDIFNDYGSSSEWEDEWDDDYDEQWDDVDWENISDEELEALLEEMLNEEN